MKKNYQVFRGLLLTVFILGGCVPGIKTGTKQIDIGNVVSKARFLKTQGKSSVDKQDSNNVGIIINIKGYVKVKERNEDTVYKEASREVKSLFEKAGINVIFISDENDPSIRDVNTLICIKYCESWTQTKEWAEFQEITCLAGPFFTPAYIPMFVSNPIIRAHYDIVIIDINTGEECYYNHVGTAINALENKL